MSALINSIAGQVFVDIQGNLDPRGEQLEILARAGFDGVIARKTGSRGEPFRLRTVAYATDFAVAQSATAALKALVGSDPLEIIKYSVNWGTFLLLNVREIECRRMANSTAGNYQVRLVHEWEFLG